MADTLNLSNDALVLLKLHLSGRSPERAPEHARPAYRELVQAGLMDPVSTFAGGSETLYRLTKAAYDRRAEFISAAAAVAPLSR
jgi:hypothetical protein